MIQRGMEMVKIRVTTHSGEDDILEVDSFDAETLNEKMNNNEIHSILIGDNIYSRIDLKNVKKMNEI